MLRFWIVIPGLLLVSTVLPARDAHGANQIQGLRSHEAPEYIRIVVDTSDVAKFKYFTLTNPHRVVVDIKNARIRQSLDMSQVATGLTGVRGIRGAVRGEDYRLVVDANVVFKPKPFTLKPIASYGNRLVLDLFFTDANRDADQPREEPEEPDRDVRIAIDAGHGGEDPGALGPGRTLEKTVVLQIARKIVDRLKAKPGIDAFLIRTGDYYLGHRKRTQLARDKRADLFVSIHADAFKQASVSGASVYTLSERGASSETAKWLAERENQSDLLGGVGTVSLSDRDPVVAQVILDLSMNGNRSQSIQVGEAVLKNMGRVTKLHKKQVEQAAFLVLKSPDMPSILVETGFISNPKEAKRLSQRDHQQRVASAIATGIAEFMQENPPPGTRLANRSEEVNYQVAKGDTLSEIALRYGVTASALKVRNRIQGDRIRVGQTIVIPRR